MKARILFLLALFCLPFPVAADVTVASPDGKVQFVLSSSAQRHLQYTVTFNSKRIIEPSPVGIVVDRADLADGARRSGRRKATRSMRRTLGTACTPPR